MAIGMNPEQLEGTMKKYAEKQGFRLQPDRELLTEILKGLLENEKRYGLRYCPCRILTGDRIQDAKIICPCAYHKEEIRKDGHCHCGLFLAKP